MPKQPAGKRGSRSANAPKSVGKREMRTFLEGSPRESLIDQIMGLFNEIEQVREHYQGRLRGDDEQVRAKYKARIGREFSWTGRSLPRLGVADAKRAVADYRKVAASVNGIADVMLYYVEAALEPMEIYGVTDHPSLLGSVLGMYRDAVIHIQKHGLDRDFVERSYEIVQKGRENGYWYEFQEIHDLAYGPADPLDLQRPASALELRGTMRGMSTDLVREDDRL